MAIEKNIPKDTKQFKPKLIGYFTTRQVVCIIPVAIIALILFFALGDSVNMEVKFAILSVFAVPAFLIGWYEPYGLPFEAFAKTVFVSLVLSPKHRKYKTERIEEAMPEKKSVPQKKKTKSKTVDPELASYK